MVQKPKIKPLEHGKMPTKPFASFMNSLIGESATILSSLCTWPNKEHEEYVGTHTQTANLCPFQLLVG